MSTISMFRRIVLHASVINDNIGTQSRASSAGIIPESKRNDQSPFHSLEYSHYDSPISMARIKQRTPMKRDASNGWIDHRELQKSEANGRMNGNGVMGHAGKTVASLDADRSLPEQVAESQQAGLSELLICAGGIYASLYEQSRSSST